MPNLFSANGNTLKVDIGGYDAGITDEIDQAIRHMPVVVDHLMEKAAQLKGLTGSPNFELVISADPSNRRPRVYVVPKNNKGIREELSESVLLKAALGMSGQ